MSPLLCAQFYANLYGIPVPTGQVDPDIFITLEILGDATDVGLYCNPGWGQYADVNANYPQPGYAVWQSGAHTICLFRVLLKYFAWPLLPVISHTHLLSLLCPGTRLGCL